MAKNGTNQKKSISGKNSNGDTISLADIAHQAMIERGFKPDFPQAVLQEVAAIPTPSSTLHSKPGMHDLRHLLWVSIDNDDSKDLDQLTFAEVTDTGINKIYVAVADVDALVPNRSPIDAYASYNTTSVYTPTKVFPMLPERLSTDLTSLNENADRFSVVIEMEIAKDGEFKLIDIYPAWVKNMAKLTYNGVAAFLEQKIPLNHPSPKIAEIQEQLKLQDRIAHHIKEYRFRQGALALSTIEVAPVIEHGIPVGLRKTVHNRANSLIENFMISANSCVTHFLDLHKLPTLRRVVREPKRWDRIVALAKKYGVDLPSQPDPKPLRDFLIKQRNADPLHFPDLSIAVIKLIGRGEYVLGLPGKPAPGHFDLALIEYAHTTAPNRRFPDLVMQRLLKSYFYPGPTPYTLEELAKIADHCTQKEDDATKVERRVRKSAAAMVIQPQIGRVFSAMVTGSSIKGTYVRLLAMPLEGRLVDAERHYDVGDHLTVKLIGVDVLKGYIDFIESK